MPTGRLPRSDKRFGSGVVLAALAHAALGVLMLWSAERALDDYQKAVGEPGFPGGGGGGGGGATVRYIELPPLPSRAAPEPKRSQEVRVPPPPPPLVQPPEPEVRVPERFETALATAEPVPVNVGTSGAGSGSGSGPGAGSGSGGGTGTGQGTGVGSGVGPGTGGEGGTVISPVPRAVVYPFEDAPPSAKGVEYRIRFWVDRRGRPVRVEIEPEIQDAAFRKKLLDRMREWVFYPARTLEGRPVEGQLVITYTP